MKKIVMMMVACGLMVACGNGREKAVKDIEAMELQLSTVEVGGEQQEAMELVQRYRQYAHDYADDSLSPVYLQRAADLCINSGMAEQALGMLDSVIELYPGYDDVAGCSFLKGYAYEVLERYDEAREAYTSFVETYPDHYLAEDVSKTLPYIGMSAEEMLDAIMKSASDRNLAQAQK